MSKTETLEKKMQKSIKNVVFVNQVQVNPVNYKTTEINISFSCNNPQKFDIREILQEIPKYFKIKQCCIYFSRNTIKLILLNS